jgi:hypothetical protein
VSLKLVFGKTNFGKWLSLFVVPSLSKIELESFSRIHQINKICSPLTLFGFGRFLPFVQRIIALFDNVGVAVHRISARY